MRNPIGRLSLWMADLLDRSMIAVPDGDLPVTCTARSAIALGAESVDYQQL